MPEACIASSDPTLGYNSHPAVHHLDGVVRRGSPMAVIGADGSLARLPQAAHRTA